MALRKILVPVFALILSALLAPDVWAHGSGGDQDGTHPLDARETALQKEIKAQVAADRVMGPDADCPDGLTAPVVEGPVTLTECYQRDFTVIGGSPRTIRVWYTTDTNDYDVDGETYVHGIPGETEAADVADAVQEAWNTVFAHSAIGGHTAHEPYIEGCSSVLNIQIRDGKGWSGIAYWGASGSCNIGIDGPMVNDGVSTGDDGVVFHEVQHYTQYSYNNGCYADFQPLYSAGNSWIEGWANLAGKNATTAANDALYSVSSYDSSTSYYDLSYTDLHAQYLLEHYGGNGAPGDSNFGVKEIYEHYRQCDQYDDIFVMDETIMALTGGAKTERWAFVDFEAAYYAYKYANPVTQPELVFPDTDDKPTGTPAFAQNVNIGAPQNFPDTSPDTWTGKYYRFNPQAGCLYVELHVETNPLGGEVGINFMAAKTTSPTSVLRSAHIGDNATRFFAGFGANDQLIVNVTSFDSVETYKVTATCVTPSLNILTPLRNPGHAMVGAPDSPVATLTRFEVKSGGLAVSGIVSSTISFDAEGDAPTLVPGSFQEVGPGEYWAAIIPPVKPAGTTFVDYEVCLNTSICDMETDALLYIDPGNVDTVYAIDESGSMDTEDTPGEGKRIDNAKRAATVLADLLHNDDRIGIIGFGGADNPPGCGIDGGGDGNCANGNIERLARINDVEVPTDTVTVRAAIASSVKRDVWTNIGQALIDSKDMLLANPGNTNPDHIILLSDGRENANPLYDTPAVRDVLHDAGVCVDTIGLGPEAPGALLAQIAAQNCGTYMPVPTSGLGTGLVSAAMAEGVDGIAAVDQSSYYPAQLGVANANEYLDVVAQDSSRIFHFLHRAVSSENFSTHFAVIDKSVQSFQFLVVSKQPDKQRERGVEILPPGEQKWIPISPPVSGTIPADWEIRLDTYQDVLIVKEPKEGLWGFRARILGNLGDYIMNLSVDSTIHLEGLLLNLNNGMANAGDVVPIVGTLLDENGLIPGAAVVATIASEFYTETVVLLDDGAHNDGSANDGIYGFPFVVTAGGSHAVRIVALLKNPANPAEILFREWNGGFWVDGPQFNEAGGQEPYGGDTDKDGMPDDWEKRCGLNIGINDSKEDFDHDGLINISELQHGTSPCQPDTDHGGELDGSEVNAKPDPRNPLVAKDDKAFKVKGITLRPFDKMVAIDWSRRISNTKTFVCVSTIAGQLGKCQEMITPGKESFELPGLTNNTPYYLTLYGEGEGGAQGDYSDQMVVTPKEDPIPPQGAFFIGGPNVKGGGDIAITRSVTLEVDALDTPNQFEGPAGYGSHSIPHGLVGPQFAGKFAVSGDVEMRFADPEEGIASAQWEPLAAIKPWQLECEDNEVCTVFGQFKDAAENESLIIDQQILLQIPVVNPTTPKLKMQLPFVSAKD